MYPPDRPEAPVQPIAVPIDTPPAVSPKPAAPNGILFGADGLRAGWSFLLYVVLVAIFSFCASSIYARTHHDQVEKSKQRAALAKRDPAAAKALNDADRAKQGLDEKPSNTLTSHGVPLVVTCLAALIMAFIERRRFSWYAFWSNRIAKDLLLGLFWGIVCMSLLVASLRALHVLSFDGILLNTPAALRSGATWFAAFLLVGLAEEYLFRGYIQYTLTRGIRGMFPPENPNRRLFGFWLAAALLSLLFLSAHVSNSGETRVGLLSVFLAGMVFCFALWRTGSLWWAIGFHAAWDWAQSFLYGVGDSGTFAHGRLMATHPQGSPLLSGGATGPEGSILVLPVFVLILVIIHVTLPQRDQPPIAPLNLTPLPGEVPQPFIA